jgi:hypothetical protein
VTIIKRTPGEIQKRRGIREVLCRAGCGTTVLITSTESGKTVVLDDQGDGELVINENNQAIRVADDGDYGFHHCPMYDEAY